MTEATDEPAIEAVDSERLLAFYDRLRVRMEAALSRRIGGPASAALLAAPDLFVLLVRLFFDSEVPQATRALIGGALVYFVLPVDLVPEALLGFGGFVDDVVISATVLAHVMATDLKPVVVRQWSGSRHLHAVLADAAGAADALLSSRLQSRLAQVLARYGVDLKHRDEHGADYL